MTTTRFARDMIDLYCSWIGEMTELERVNEITEITTPFLDRHNDCLQVYMLFVNGVIRLTDGGYILNDLYMSGCDVDSSKTRRELLTLTLNGFNVSRHDDNLQIEVEESNFPRGLHNLLQAMLAVNDMFVLSRSRVASVFKEDVSKWLTEHKLIFTENVRYGGISGLEHRFDFKLRPGNDTPDRLIRVMQSPSRDLAESLVFSVIDVREKMGEQNLEGFAFLNDLDAIVPNEVLDAMNQYKVHPVIWSSRDEVLGLLNA